MIVSWQGEMVDLIPSIEGASRVKFRIATRGLLGLRNAMLTATRGVPSENAGRMPGKK